MVETSQLLEVRPRCSAKKLVLQQSDGNGGAGLSGSLIGTQGEGLPRLHSSAEALRVTGWQLVHTLAPTGI